MGCNDCDGTKPISSDAVVHQCFSSCNSKADRAQYMENCQNACESGRKDSEVNDAADLSKKCDDKWEDLKSSNKLEELCNDCDGTKPISSDAVVHQCFSSWNSKADRAQYMVNRQTNLRNCAMIATVLNQFRVMLLSINVFQVGTLKQIERNIWKIVRMLVKAGGKILKSMMQPIYQKSAMISGRTLNR